MFLGRLIFRIFVWGEMRHSADSRILGIGSMLNSGLDLWSEEFIHKKKQIT